MDIIGEMIVTQEKNGQETFNRENLIPIEMRNVTKEEMEGMGFIFGDRYDDLFMQCILPEGWRKEPAEDSQYWSYIFDENNKKVFAIFYKAAFYDRGAFIRKTGG